MSPHKDNSKCTDTSSHLNSPGKRVIHEKNEFAQGGKLLSLKTAKPHAFLFIFLKVGDI